MQLHCVVKSSLFDRVESLKSLYVNLSKIAPTLFPFKDFDNEQWQRSLLTLGKIMDREQRARQVIDEHNQRIATARAELEPISRKP
jgi:iron complex transport system substrate-binding protein